MANAKENECCPEGAWPPLPKKGSGSDNLDFEEAVVEVKDFKGTDLYVSGLDDPNVNKENCVIVNFDIYGWRKQTRIRYLCDKLASDPNAGYLVVMPDYFHNDDLPYCEPKDDPDNKGA